MTKILLFILIKNDLPGPDRNRNEPVLVYPYQIMIPFRSVYRFKVSHPVLNTTGPERYRYNLFRCPALVYSIRLEIFWVPNKFSIRAFMVSTRIEGRIEGLEKTMTEVQEGLFQYVITWGSYETGCTTKMNVTLKFFNI
ncbi:hypothetical protein H5410_001442 [Solanum commersonii]|uniref:Uncharacterized protein n=1 Tax=Solanum commersonii TaxID=4109 RepID=A0A9J6AYR8_SOLCO|nr:hypothetical protein H5410_001442 [Solanum commersonii]